MGSLPSPPLPPPAHHQPNLVKLYIIESFYNVIIWLFEKHQFHTLP